MKEAKKKDEAHYQQFQLVKSKLQRTMKVKILFFILLSFSSSKKMFSQNTTNKICALLYNDIRKQTEYNLIKARMQGTILITDPIDGKQKFQYSTKVNESSKAEFEKFSKVEQLKILSGQISPILLKDTLTLIDSTGFFVESVMVLGQGRVVTILKNRPNRNCSNCLSLFAIGLRGNNLILTFQSKKFDKQLFNYYFELNNDSIKLQKSSVIDNKLLLE